MRVTVHQDEGIKASLESNGHYEIGKKHVFDEVARGTLHHSFPSTNRDKVCKCYSIHFIYVLHLLMIRSTSPMLYCIIESMM